MSKVPPPVLIELQPSRIEGVGVFAVPNIRRGLKIAAGINDEDYQELHPWESFENYEVELRKKIMEFCIGTPEGFIPPENLDFNKLSIEWFLNHSCEGNCGFDDNGDFIALREVAAGEELTYDYGLAESNPQFVMDCLCDSPACRQTVTGNDWKDESFQIGHREHMLPRLRRPVLVSI